jgi:Zn-dependent peptidase ImmA (M78 family)/transcriptional regulator with XRE-family HTH domain
MSSQFGDALRRLRMDYDLQIQQVARFARLDPARLSAIESGEEPTVRELACVAGALGTDPAMIYSGKIPPPTRTVARFRSPLGIALLPGTDARLLARAAEVGRICADLQSRLQKSSHVAAARQVRNVTARVPWQEGYTLGAAARDRLSVPAGPLVSLQRALEGWGVHVASVEFDTDGIEASSIFEKSAAPVILLNSRARRAREILSRRAVLSHEICHLLHDGGERDLTVVSRESDNSVQEQRANGFAPNFLAPKNELRNDQDLEALRTRPARLVQRIAAKWGLTYGGAIWHAKNAKLLEASTAEQMQREEPVRIDAAGWEPNIERVTPPKFGIDVKISRLSDGLLADLALVALEHDLISEGRAAEILTLE